ncbi:MAG: J domain-containing protein [Alphaproteobacteria bacterium]|nr:J domain-containing protein [Alphaproteobacteria bacterium]
MSERYAYRPPFGLDIRVNPEGRPRLREGEMRRCEWPGCSEAGAHRAPKSPKSLEDHAWYCLDHVREYNRSWNFFQGMDAEEVARFQEEIVTGHRPTWKLGEQVGGRLRGIFSTRFSPRDPHAFMGGAAPAEEAARSARRLTGPQQQALEIFDLDAGATLKEIKARYKELLKRFHPDTNGGDRSTEGQLRRVIRAYQILKAGKLV